MPPFSLHAPAQGWSLRSRLVALVLIPVLGMAGFTSFSVMERLDRVHTAAEARVLIEDTAALDLLRGSLMQEIFPSLSLTIFGDPAKRAELSLGSVATPTDAMRQDLKRTRTATDVALEAALSRPSIHEDLTPISQDLASVRSRLDSAGGSGSAGAFATALDFVGRVEVQETDRIARVTRLGLTGDAAIALRDVGLVTRAVQAAGMETSFFTSTKIVGNTPEGVGAQLQLFQSWGAFEAASDEILTTASPDIREKWATALANPEVKTYDQIISFSKAENRAPVSKPTLDVLLVTNQLLQLDGKRNAEFSTVLQTSTQSAVIAAAGTERDAERQLWVFVLVSVLLTALALWIGALVHRSIARPLKVLAEQAGRVSRGELSDVKVSGPREVQTVAVGLADAVASLRRIQDTSQAVLEGQLDSDIVQQALPGRLGEVVHASVSRIIEAIQAQETAQLELAHLAAHDALTELPNRAQALTVIERSLHRAARAGSATGLMFVDLDYFKRVNDTFGHAAGDKVLQIAAQRMIDAVRDGDTVARLGGDEFVILLEDITHEADAVKMAHRLIKSVSTPMQVADREIAIGASVGFAVSRDGSVDASALLKEADAAAYQAKRSGRGQVGIFDESLRESLHERACLENAMLLALQNGEFMLHYQPVVDLTSGDTTGVEALIRWNRPGYGMVPPDVFIPTAELSNLINDIGRWTLHEATNQLALWAQDSYLRDLTIAVNISGRHLSSPHLVEDVRKALTKSGVDASRLILEITETVLVDDPRALSNMAEIRRLGVLLALDDFGTGFTSIGQLANLPIDILKIDRTFTASENPTHASLVELMVTAAHTFSLNVVAEGIETAQQVQELRRVAADTGQGYFFARPTEASRIIESIRAKAQPEV